MTATVQDVSKFKMLSEIEHVLKRPGRYIGSAISNTEKDWVIVNGKVEEGRNLWISPAFNKLFDEIISNSTDHAGRPEGKHLNKIEVDVNCMLGTISVRDNGGIPVQKHPDTGLWIPDMIFGHLRSGSNFDDEQDSTTTGQNGEGSSLVNIFSTFFNVDTSDGHNRYTITYEDNMLKKGKESITPWKSNHTCIIYTPDFKALDMKNGIDNDALLMIEKRCYEVAATNPNIKIYFQGCLIDIKNFKDFVGMFGECIYQSIDRWNVGLIHSQEGFSHESFVNATNTFQGGTHIDYVMDKIVESVREHIEKKTKQSIRPSEIKSQFKLFLDVKINNPRYDAQTKGNLITPVSKYGTQFEVTDKFAKDIIASPIMKRILEWAERRKAGEDLKLAQKEVDEARKATFHHIPKYCPATEKDRSKCMLFLAEGDSALKPLKAAKKSIHGLFPLRGKPNNVFGQSIKALTKQEEFQYVIQIMGIDLTGNVDVDKVRYGAGIVISTDADVDGTHIRGLLTVAFQRFWPQLIDKGLLKFLRTPIIICTRGKETFEFFTDLEYKDWSAAQTKKYDFKYYKGLGTHETINMIRFMNEPKYLQTVLPLDEVDIEKLNMAFDPNRSDDRKEWLDVA